MTNASCPLSYESIDATLARYSSVGVILLTMGALLSMHPIFVVLLILDFAFKSFNVSKFSFSYWTSQLIKRLFNLQSTYTDGAPKKLAAYFGLSFSILMLMTLYFGFGFFTVGLILLACALLELLFDYCLGCKIYFLYHKVF